MQNLRPSYNLSSRILRTFYNHSKHETYYDILRVSKDCTNKEVKEAFVKLSKQHHPDVKGHKGTPKQTAEFVKISEAYQILSKPHLRRDYDRTLNVTEGSIHSSGGLHTTETYRPWEIRPNRSADPGPYYGIDGLGKVSNSKIALIMVGLAIFGAVFGFLSANHMSLKQKNVAKKLKLHQIKRRTFKHLRPTKNYQWPGKPKKKVP